MFGNPHDEGANADDPRHQHTAQGQRQWQEAKAHAQTPIFQGARLSRLVAILELLNIQAKHKASNTMLLDIFSIVIASCCLRKMFCQDLGRRLKRSYLP
jgi:hypothetical protein